MLCLLAVDFRLQLIDSAATVECPEYADLLLKPVSFVIQQLFSSLCGNFVLYLYGWHLDAVG